jgi:predicted transcriptional regulator
MRIRIFKRRKPADIEYMLASLAKKYGSLNSLQQRVQISKCESPEQMADYIIWRNLSQGAEFQDTVVVRDSDIFEVMTPKRMELLEHLMNNDVASIRTLAAALHRNYKNTYDDLRALSRYDLVDLDPHGRSLRPAASARCIEVVLDD